MTVLILCKLWLLPMAIIQVIAAPASNVPRDGGDPTVTISFPKATITGQRPPAMGWQAEEFLGIPFALPPVGGRRLKPPLPITQDMGTILAKNDGNICPQLIFSTAPNEFVPLAILSQIAGSPEVQAVTTQSEDCLQLNVSLIPSLQIAVA